MAQQTTSRHDTAVLGLQPADWVRQLRAYDPPRPRGRIDLKLDANEGPVADTACLQLLSGQSLRAYPSKSDLERQIAAIYGIAPSQVLVTCGGDDTIDRVCRAFLQAGRNMVIPEPTFVMMRQYATMAGGEVRSVAWPHSRFPVEAICRVADDQTSVIAVVSPNNPTGARVSADQLRELARACPRSVLLVDQAYAEFEEEDHQPQERLTEVALREIPNAVVVRTFSKAWGLAGLRVGYGLGRPELMEWLRRAGSPYPVSGPSLAIAASAIAADPRGHRQYLRQVRQERTALRELLIELGADASPSQGNFVLARFSSPLLTASFVADALAALGISVRSFAAIPDALRITCPGDPAAFDRLCQALRTALAPEAVLFDMDGVLVDEAPSYREAIRLTCQAFGQAISMEEIAQAKLGGDANNDWEFSRRLLRERGVDCSLEEVTECFERYYQGDTDTPGLWQREVRLVNPEWLRRLSQRYPLAIVTGRPRGDAIRFLDQYQLTDYFQAIVCLEDGPTKPDPANVLTALAALGKQAAWMIGDTPDDMDAARRARVMPFGIVAPQDDRQYATERLQAAVAVRILDDLETLDEYLP